MRQQLRTLREQWETYSDNLNDTLRHLDTTLAQWAIFHDLYSQLEKWVQDTEHHLLAEVQLKNTLPEKKAQLQEYKVCV